MDPFSTPEPGRARKRMSAGAVAAPCLFLTALVLGAALSASAALCSWVGVKIYAPPAPGQPVIIPLVCTAPDCSEAGEPGLLYRDLLSECVTYVGGTAARLGNVKRAAELCNGQVLLPGDTFSYNRTVGERTTARGFRPAPSYVGGMTVDTVGGGICQVSSSLYYCMVYANLQAVTRYNHGFAVSYVPDGLDATVSWGSLDFRFKNTSDYPVKIAACVQDRTLTVQFYGTNPDGIYVQAQCERLSTKDYATVYRADSSVPRGTTQVSVTPCTGREVAVYRCVYAADGTLISRSLENTSNYAARNEVILYHPADAASLGLTPPAGTDPPVEGGIPFD